MIRERSCAILGLGCAIQGSCARSRGCVARFWAFVRDPGPGLRDLGATVLDSVLPCATRGLARSIRGVLAQPGPRVARFAGIH